MIWHRIAEYESKTKLPPAIHSSLLTVKQLQQKNPPHYRHWRQLCTYMNIPNICIFFLKCQQSKRYVLFLAFQTEGQSILWIYKFFFNSRLNHAEIELLKSLELSEISLLTEVPLKQFHQASSMYTRNDQNQRDFWNQRGRNRPQYLTQSNVLLKAGENLALPCARCLVQSIFKYHQELRY